MTVCLFFFFFFFLSAQWDGSICRTAPENIILIGREGGNFTHKCLFFFSGKTKRFCKRECEDKDLLIETDESRAQSGRYSIMYADAPGLLDSSVLSVSITNLRQSDSGRYRCRLDRYVFPNSNVAFEIRVENGPSTSNPNWTPRPSSTSVPSSGSSPGVSTPSSASPEQRQTAAGTPLTVGLTLAVMIVVLSAALLIICRIRASKPKEHPVETEYSNATEVNRVYEEIREEDTQGRSPPSEISTVYTCVQFTKPEAAETTDNYSFAAASQKKKESSELIYSQVDFPNGASASLNSAPCGKANDVIYSTPRIEASSEAPL